MSPSFLLIVPKHLRVRHDPGGPRVPSAQDLHWLELVQVRIEPGVTQLHHARPRPELVNLKFRDRSQQQLFKRFAVFLRRRELADLEKIAADQPIEVVLQRLSAALRRGGW